MTAISIHLGLNYVDPKAYGGWDGELRGCHLDADAMAQLALNNGWFVSDVLLDEQATTSALDERMASFAALLEAGDRLLISYSGHGGQRPDVSGDELDGMDETWLLFDSELVDDRIGGMLARFRPGVKIVIISDSCHSGTISRAPRARPAVKLPDPEIDIVQASVITLSGCSDEQTSADMATGGRFTVNMLEQYRQLQTGAGWRTLHRVTLQSLLHLSRDPRSAVQEPQLTFSGPLDPAFVDERPFTA